MSEPLKIAVAGLGTVGTGVIDLLKTHRELIAARAGRPVDVVAVSARDRNRDRGVDLSAFAWFDNAAEMARDADCDVVVELIGGEDGIARDTCEAALSSGRDVVTANKALVAAHGTALAKIAEAGGVAIAYEAAVAGGIPIIKALREGLAGNRIERVYGILNGTCNYILTTMRETGRDFSDVLAEAQELGYAEADPTFDVEGIDAAHKLAILASLAFGVEVDFDGVHVEGISHVSADDIAYADELGYRIKLLGIASKSAAGVSQRVHPCMVPKSAPIAAVEGVFNAVVADGDYVGNTVFQGRGAGAGPTASAVVADIADIARGLRPPTFGVPADRLEKATRAPMDDLQGAYYIRLMVDDRPGVIADITAVLRDEQVSMEAMLQRARDPEGPVPVVMTTHETQEAGLRRALKQIETLDTVAEPPRVIRIEPFSD